MSDRAALWPAGAKHAQHETCTGNLMHVCKLHRCWVKYVAASVRKRMSQPQQRKEPGTLEDHRDTHMFHSHSCCLQGTHTSQHRHNGSLIF